MSKAPLKKIRILLNEKLNSDFVNKDKIKKDIKEKNKKKEFIKTFFMDTKLQAICGILQVINPQI